MKRSFVAMCMVVFSLRMVVWADDIDVSRIVSVDANATEILVRLGLAQNLVAVDVTSQSLVADRALPDLGYHRALSVEGILSSEPTLVVGSSHMGPAAVVDTLNNTEIPLIQLHAANDVSELTKNIETLGEALRLSSTAANITAEVNEQLELIQNQQSGNELTMIFLLNMSGRGLSQAGSGTTGDALIQLVGGANPSQYGGYKSIAIEALIELNPDVIFIGNGSEEIDAAKELLEANPLLSVISAVKNDRLLNVDAGKMVAGVSLGVMTEALRLSQLVY